MNLHSLKQALLRHVRRMECADDDEGIFRFTDVLFVGRAKEQVQVFGFDKVVHVFLAYLFDGLIITVVFFAAPI